MYPRSLSLPLALKNQAAGEPVQKPRPAERVPNPEKQAAKAAAYAAKRKAAGGKQ